MEIIKCIAEKITEEVHDADAYIELAMEYKEDEPDAAETFYELSTEEIGHAEKLHEVVEDLIRDYREKNGKPPEGMMTLYEYLHEKQIQEAMRVRVKQGMYKAE